MKSLMLIIALLQGIIPMEGSFLRQMQKRDSVLIGDQLQYGVLLEDVTEGTSFMLPDLSKGLRDSVEVLGGWQIDTVKTRRYGKGHKVHDIEVRTLISSFDEGLYDLPPISVVRKLSDGQVDTLVFKGLSLDVRTMPVDTATFTPHDIKPQMKYPVTPDEVLPWVGGLWVITAIAVLIWALLTMRRRREEVRQEMLEPAHIVALRKLDKYRSSKFWAPEKQKAFYSGITDALREYMARRYEIGAMEMTTAEIFEALRDTDVPKYLYTDMKGLFERSDFVKFAKMTVPEEDNAKVLPSAVRFVTETYRSEVEAESEAAEGTPAQETTPMNEAAPEEDNSRFMPK
ncbi:MAG: hypothetical protein IJ795_07450 [Bacteroidales bacterium]|nr:hypothetical protein [Bacteroidales bacterium]